MQDKSEQRETTPNSTPNQNRKSHRKSNLFGVPISSYLILRYLCFIQTKNVKCVSLFEILKSLYNSTARYIECDVPEQKKDESKERDGEKDERDRERDGGRSSTRASDTASVSSALTQPIKKVFHLFISPMKLKSLFHQAFLIISKCHHFYRKFFQTLSFISHLAGNTLEEEP